MNARQSAVRAGPDRVKNNAGNWHKGNHRNHPRSLHAAFPIRGFQHTGIAKHYLSCIQNQFCNEGIV